MGWMDGTDGKDGMDRVRLGQQGRANDLLHVLHFLTAVCSSGHGNICRSKSAAAAADDVRRSKGDDQRDDLRGR